MDTKRRLELHLEWVAKSLSTRLKFRKVYRQAGKDELEELWSDYWNTLRQIHTPSM